MTWKRVLAIAGLVAVAVMAGAVSYTHQYELAAHTGQSELLARGYPATIDGLIAACGGMVAMDRAAGWQPRLWAVTGFWLGFAASAAANWLATPGGVIAHLVSAFPAIAFLWSFEALTGRPTKRLKALPQVAAPLEMPVLEILAAPEEQAVVAPAAVELPQAKPTPAKRVAKAGKATAGKAEVTVMAIANALLKLPSGTAKELAGLANTSERTVRRYKPEALAKVASLAN